MEDNNHIIGLGRKNPLLAGRILQCQTVCKYSKELALVEVGPSKPNSPRVPCPPSLQHSPEQAMIRRQLPKLPSAPWQTTGLLSRLRVSECLRDWRNFHPPWSSTDQTDDEVLAPLGQSLVHLSTGSLPDLFKPHLYQLNVAHII